MADTASYAGAMKISYPDPRRAAAKKQAGRRRAKQRQKRRYLNDPGARV